MDRILRTMLFVPASSWRMITSAATEGEDAAILDLEDACPMGEKETGRIFARDSIPLLKERGVDVFVRVNPLDSGLVAEDVGYVVVKGLDGIMLPKSESKEDIVALDRLLREEEETRGLQPDSTTIIPLLETPKGILGVSEIIAASRRVVGVSFGAGDYSREIGAGMGVTKLSPEQYSLMVFHARSSIALAARAAGVLAMDSPFLGLVIDIEALTRESQEAKLLGFTGKQIVHPRHIDPVNEVFSPAREDIDLAKQVVAAYDEARARGLGAASFGGKMIDYGSYRRAVSLLSLAQAIAQKEQHWMKDPSNIPGPVAKT